MHVPPAYEFARDAQGEIEIDLGAEHSRSDWATAPIGVGNPASPGGKSVVRLSPLERRGLPQNCSVNTRPQPTR